MLVGAAFVPPALALVPLPSHPGGWCQAFRDAVHRGWCGITKDAWTQCFCVKRIKLLGSLLQIKEHESYVLSIMSNAFSFHVNKFTA